MRGCIATSSPAAACAGTGSTIDMTPCLHRLAACATYSLTKGQQAIRDLADNMWDATGNLPSSLASFPTTALRLSATRRTAFANSPSPMLPIV
jgi:hypothetical protein